MRTTPIHNWRWDQEMAAFVPPTTDLVRLRTPRDEDPTLLIPHASSITEPEQADALAGALVQGADLLRLMADPARELTALRERVAELEARQEPTHA